MINEIELNEWEVFMISVDRAYNKVFMQKNSLIYQMIIIIKLHLKGVNKSLNYKD